MSTTIIKSKTKNKLSLGDLHCHNYDTYNPTKDFRLYQFLVLAQEIVDIAHKNDCDEVWILGDLLFTNKPAPKVMRFLKKFFKIITDSGLVIRFIYGNHDLSIKNGDTHIDEYKYSTHLSSLEDDHLVHGYDNEVVDFEGIKVQFASWMPGNNIIYKDADYLMTHGDVDPAISLFVNNLIDTSNYKRTIAGHIHIPHMTDKFISPGSPIPHGFGDPKDSHVVIFNLEKNEGKHVKLDDTKFLRFQYYETLEEKRQLEAELPHKHVHYRKQRAKPKSGQIIDNAESVTLSNFELDPKSVLNSFMSTTSDKAKDIIINSITSIDTADDEELLSPNLKFKLKKLTAKNFLSIKNIDINFEHFNGITSIVGPIGSGKSTMNQLVKYMLKGDLPGMDKSDYTSMNKDPFLGELELEYEGKQYYIRRTLGSLKATENGDPIDSNSKRDLQKELEMRLKFISFMNILFIGQSSSGIFASMNDGSKVSFLSKLIGLSLIKKWTKSLDVKIDSLSKVLQLSKDKVVNINNTISNNTNVINEYSSYSLINIEELNDNKVMLDLQINAHNQTINSNRNELSALKTKLHVYTENSSKLNILTNEILAADARIELFKNELDKNYSEFNAEEVNLKIKALTESMESYNNDLLNTIIPNRGQLQLDLQDKLVNLKIFEDKLNHYNNHPTVCPTCTGNWAIDNLDTKIEALTSVINPIKDEIEVIKSKIISINDSKSSTESFIQDLKELIKMRSSSIEKYNLIINEINKLNSSKELKIKEKELLGNLSESDKVLILQKINELESIITDKTSIINALTEQVNAILKQLGSCDINNKIVNDRELKKSHNEELVKEIESLNTQLQDDSKLIEELDKFNSKILSEKGLLVAKLLEKVSEYLNDDESLQVVTTETLQNGSVKPVLNIKMFMPDLDQFVDYDKLSGGNKLLADIKFLKCITNAIGGIGTIFMDEVFKFFDDKSVVESSEILKEANIDSIMLILHGGHEAAISDNIIKVSLSKEKGSTYERVL